MASGEGITELTGCVAFGVKDSRVDRLINVSQEETMAELTDIAHEFIRQEIEEFIERPDERQRTINTFAKARPEMQAIAAALIEGENETVDQLTRRALDSGIEALEVMDYGLIAGMGIVGIKFRQNFIFVPEVLACARAMTGRNLPKRSASLSPVSSTSSNRSLLLD